MPLLKLALQSGAGDPYFHYALGNCQFKVGEYAEAAIALTTATRPLNRRRHRGWGGRWEESGLVRG